MESCCDPLIAPDAPLEIVLLFSTGLLISLGHCMGMCGPIVTAFGIAQRARGVAGRRSFPVLLRYHGGRVLSYVIIGALFGLVGSATRLTGATQNVSFLRAGLVNGTHQSKGTFGRLSLDEVSLSRAFGPPAP